MAILRTPSVLLRKRSYARGISSRVMRWVKSGPRSMPLYCISSQRYSMRSAGGAAGRRHQADGRLGEDWDGSAEAGLRALDGAEASGEDVGDEDGMFVADAGRVDGGVLLGVRHKVILRLAAEEHAASPGADA